MNDYSAYVSVTHARFDNQIIFMLLESYAIHSGTTGHIFIIIYYDYIFYYLSIRADGWTDLGPSLLKLRSNHSAFYDNAVFIARKSFVISSSGETVINFGYLLIQVTQHFIFVDHQSRINN
jgi:hypothetical protein